MAHFWTQNGPFAPNNFFWKLLVSFLSNYYPLSLCKISKKPFQRIQSYEDVQFWGIKWPICPNENFFRKPVNEPCSFHSCLSTCQKSKSDFNLLVKFDNKGILKSHYPRAIFGCNLKTRLFSSMQFSQNINDP